ncbi:baseplate wedge subunit [Vibrio phage EniLVp02]
MVNISELQTINRGSYVYSDIPANFAKSSISNDLGASYDVRAVQESIVGIVTTPKGSMPFDPEFGCDVNNQLFENVSVVTAYAIQNSIREAVALYEPRVVVAEVAVNPDYDNNAYEVSIHYTLVTDYTTGYTTNFALRGGE